MEINRIMINKITKENAKDLNIDFEYLIDDFYDESYNVHRNGSSFYKKSIVEINEECFPDIPRELDGFWETNTYVWDDKYGYEDAEINELNRVEEKIVVTTTTEWVIV
jgi:hypothetical protein